MNKLRRAHQEKLAAKFKKLTCKPKHPHKKMERALDHALESTFPASDAVARY